MSKNAKVQEADVIEEVKNNIREYGFDVMLTMIKGAGNNEVCNIKKNLAVSLVCNDSLIKEPLGLTVASEFADMGQGLCKAAHNIDKGLADDLMVASREYFKMAKTEIYGPLLTEIDKKYGLGNFDNNILKSAISIGDIGLLRMLMDDEHEGRAEEEEEEEEGASTLQFSKSDDSSEAREEEPINEDVISVQAEDEESEEFVDKYEDLIDQALRAPSLGNM